MTSEPKWRGWLFRTFLPLVLAVPIGYFLPSRAFAGDQAPAGAATRSQTQRQHNGSSLDDRVSQFAKSLDLSEAQQSAVKKILEQRQQQTLRIRLEPSISGSARISQFRALQESTVERIRAVLNEEQKKKYNPLVPRTIPQTPQPSVEDWIKVSTPH